MNSLYFLVRSSNYKTLVYRSLNTKLLFHKDIYYLYARTQIWGIVKISLIFGQVLEVDYSEPDHLV
jgi:hypothetical protein